MQTLCPGLLQLNLCLKILGDAWAQESSRNSRPIAHAPPPAPEPSYGSKAITDRKRGEGSHQGCFALYFVTTSLAQGWSSRNKQTEKGIVKI